MKTYLPAVLQFSGYPLRVVEDNVPYFHVEPISNGKKHQENKLLKLGTKVPVDVNDPTRWDLDWFGNYE